MQVPRCRIQVMRCGGALLRCGVGARVQQIADVIVVLQVIDCAGAEHPSGCTRASAHVLRCRGEDQSRSTCACRGAEVQRFSEEVKQSRF